MFVRHTHKEVPIADLDAWMKIYGTLVTESTFCKTGEFENDVYTVKIKLQYLIPEFLPIKGKRARVYYHGIPPYCIVCNTPGHTKPECPNEPVPWSSYIQSLKDTGIPAILFEPISENPNQAVRPNIFNLTPRRIPEGLSQENIQSVLQSVFSNLSNQNFRTPSTSGSGVPPGGPINPTPNPPRGRGRGSGLINPTITSTPQGRGRGRGNTTHSSSQSGQGAGRGRGRGRGEVIEGAFNKGRGSYNFRKK